jgi:hypothetical protein
MEAILDHEPVDPELLVRLGRIVVLGSQIEGWVSMLLGTMMGADLGGLSIVTNTLSLSAQISDQVRKRPLERPLTHGTGYGTSYGASRSGRSYPAGS